VVDVAILPNAIVPSDTTTEVRLGMLLILFAHACDLVSTYIRSPDLAKEVGPLYVAFDRIGWGGWQTLLSMKALGVIIGLGLFFLYVHKRRSFYPDQADRTFHEFLHDVHSKDAMRRRDGRWVAPSPMLLIVWFAFTVSIGSAAYAYFLAVHNMLGTPILAWMADGPAPGAIFMITAFVFWRTLYYDYGHREPA